ncbi:Transcription factor castor [Orchesella cincta]|uniref:Transcription factor castor n=1 Tax=Orchesella cincta TaxID=48709 RepID=A0A1D2NH39_ORCCI|nr:Transcription factor castor [Orchesella cincta]
MVGRSPTGRGLTAFPVIREGLLGKGTGPVDYTRYVRRYGNSAECGFHHCRELNYREHFHCLDCSNGTRVFVKKEEMIRHFKWHKKRDESLQHGFMRYSPMDDCSDRFHNCQHNRKQTHYHCLKESCEKVYISTSDVQMHANYHRKDSAIIQEGFQRFRAVEDCGNDNCTFRHQRTTHFHCRRPTCSYTFKNKADMEKHKSYHVKDEQLNRDGFKKFMKHETCNYTGCRFSRVCNHIHCIREGCNYVLHSSGQLYSHKRKHERRDSELAYRRFKLAQSLMRGTLAAEMSGMGISEAMLANKSEDENNSRSSFNDNPTDVDSEEIIKKFIQICQCDAAPEEHFHCKVENCRNSLLGTAEIASDHSRNHELEDRISSLAFFAVDPASFDAQDSTIPCVSAKCPYQNREKHYHCLWDACSEVILASEEAFRRLEHFRTHQYAHKMEIGDKDVPDNNDGFFKRKRGRPPKNRMIEVSSGTHDTAIFTSFKLPKPVTPGSGAEGLDVSDSDVKDPIGFLSFPEGASCPDTSCPYHQQTNTCHYHCGHSRCHFSVSDVHKLSAHLRDFHSNVDILEGYAYYDRNSDCVDTKCEFRNNADHFHCTRDGLTFVQYAVMMSHETEVHDSSKSSPSSDDDADSEHWNNQVIKAAGTFFPGSGAKENVNHNNPMDLSSPNGSVEPTEPKSITDHSLSRILQLAPTENSETQFGPDVPCGRAFCKLKRKHHYHCTLCNQAFSELDKLRPHVLKHSSFSPLKQSESEQYTDEEGSKNDGDGHQSPEPPKPISLPKEDLFAKHDIAGALTPPSFPPTSLPNFLNYSQSIASQSPYLFLQHNPLLYAGMMFGGAPPGVFQPGAMLTPPTMPPHQIQPSPHHLGVPTPPGLGLSVNDSQCNAMLVNSSLQQLQKSAGTKRPPSASSSSPSSPSDNSAKKARMQMRILKDEPVPDGYIRFRFNEDCNYPHCGYREHQTHFHCTREDCGYSFCDKTRFVQHTARHERLDTLMGGDFKQFRANISCGRSNCSYVPSPGGAQGQNKASHFHCSKCDFVCTDTNKVVAHRRQHQKLDSITAAGFEKFTPSQNCNISSCIHSQKQTHYHCLKQK